jgi:4-methylaminobutanoate oxidase (formaldehyde-forming)
MPVGLKALASLRLEKAYRDFGHDIDNTDCPLEAGLGFAVAFGKLESANRPGGFIGRTALLERRAAHQVAGGMPHRLVQIRLLDPEPLLFHAEVVYRNGVAVGHVRAGSYGWTFGGAVGLAMVSGGAVPVTPEWLAGVPDGGAVPNGAARVPDGGAVPTGAARWEVDIAGVRYPAEVSLRPRYDPTSARVRS